MVSVESIISGFIAGFLAGILQRYVWRYLRRPDLEIDGKIRKLKRQNEEDEQGRKFTTTIFRVPVHNTGKTAARNCKPSIELKGEAPPPSHIESSGTGDISGMEFEVSTGLCWSEKDNPARITINRDSTCYFDLVAIQNLQNPDDKADEILEAVTFPTESGWDSLSPVELINPVFEDGVPRPATGDYRINRDQITRANYTKAVVQVTAENAQKATAKLEFDNEMGWPEVSINSD